MSITHDSIVQLAEYFLMLFIAPEVTDWVRIQKKIGRWGKTQRGQKERLGKEERKGEG